MSITPLGSGQEVGRSCHLLEFRDMTILLDCGIHPGFEGISGLPYFDRVEPERVDVVLISHFHLDHVASLPYFTERTNFNGRIFMTHPTKAVTRLLLGDYLRLMNMRSGASSTTASSSNATNDNVLYTESELKACIDKIELIDFHQTISVKSLKFYALNAGHVLGAAMFLLEIGGRTVLYTGDYSMEDDRHLMSAEIPQNVNPDVLIVESTYGVQVHASRVEREARFTSTIERVVSRGGRCLIPVFALGRAQELLLILDEYWQSNPQLQHIPIWYASKLASRALRVYQTYANMMNARIRSQMDISNPFSFKYIQNLKSIDVNNFDDRGASVVFASPGMLQSGVSRQLFDRWCTDSKNGVVIAGYAVEHTLAREIMNQPNEVLSLDGRRQPLNCLVEYVSFSAHVDFMQNRNFISTVQPKHIILVHGQKEEMGRLKSALMLQYKQYPPNKRPTITMPPNTQNVKLKFTRRRSAKVMGSLASTHTDDIQEGEAIQGILVTQNFSSKIISPNDLSTYTPLRVGAVSSTLNVPFLLKDTSIIQLLLEQMFYPIHMNTNDDDNITIFLLQNNQLKITIGKLKNIAIIEWDADPIIDILADSVIALLMHSQSSISSIKMLSRPCSHSINAKKQDEDMDTTQQPPLKKVKEMDDVQKVNDDDQDSFSWNGIVQTRIDLINDVLQSQFEHVILKKDTIKSEDDNISTFEFVIQTEENSSSNQNDYDKNTNANNNVTARIEFDRINKQQAKIIVLDNNEDDDSSSKNSKLLTCVKECLKSVLSSATPFSLE